MSRSIERLFAESDLLPLTLLWLFIIEGVVGV